MKEIERAIEYVLATTGWQLKDVEVLSEENGTWIAYATTTHLSEIAEPELPRIVLARWSNFVTHEPDNLPALIAWCQAHARSNNRGKA